MSTPTDDPFSPQPLPQESPSTTPSRTAVLDREEAAEEKVEPGDHERFAHYVQKNKITESAVTGTPVIALCGKVWVPGRDPKRFPVCPTCKEIYEGLQRPGGGKDDGGGSGS
ncbi:DUF3039 domain-containing protein [Kineococcus rubinsiae]|uniref:DUF3039 domain-containing protein n=1 Tax=Kineococcus rubinsiae TaxID=2609562 RepID=UPI0014301714|nr:DUF3039 domain-containing protein [Kineococcus rubinsiae]NIZ90824.1 DUF3039 domain-containing protein [Kineococcus rubinsiae]